MKQLILLILLTISLQAESISIFDIDPLKMTKDLLKTIVDEDSPQWVKDQKNGKFQSQKDGKYYFIGISNSFKKSETKLAANSARQNGLSQISSFISVSISTSTSDDSQSGTNGYNRKFKKSSNTISFVELDGVIPLSNYISNENGKIIGYSLFELTKEDYETKKRENDIKLKEYNELLSGLRDSVRLNKVHLSKDLVYKLKGFKQSSKDKRFQELVTSLENAFEVDLKLNKSKFRIGESLKITLVPTKSIYVYVLLKYGNNNKIKLLFPSRFETNNFINKQTVKTLNNLKIIKKYMTKDENKIILYSSSSPINFTNFVDRSYELSNSSTASWRTMLKDKMNNSIIFKKELSFNIDKHKLTKEKICIVIEGKSSLAKKMHKLSKKVLKKQFTIKRNCKNIDYQIKLEIEDEVAYSDTMERKIRIVNYNYMVINSEEDEIYESENREMKFPKSSRDNSIYKELKNNMKDNLQEIKETIKG